MCVEELRPKVHLGVWPSLPQGVGGREGEVAEQRERERKREREKEKGRVGVHV